jgi:hypothetical protein
LAWVIDIATLHGEDALRLPLPASFAGWAHVISHAANVQAVLATPAA